MGVFSITLGNISDRIGRRRILLPALVLFSVLSGLTGMVGGVGMLILTRAIMGAAEGAFLPTSVAATAEASQPRRRGRNQGFQLGAFALFGFGFAPIVATQLLQIVPSWRYVFMLVAIPGLVIALLLFRILKDPPHLTRASTAPRRHIPWSDLFKSRNVILAAAGLVCAMSCVFVMGAMVPNYLTDHMKLSGPTMGFVMSAMGWGGFLGEFGVAGISDFIGRKRATIIAFIGAAISTWECFHVSAGIPMLFLWLGIVWFFGLGLTSILTGPVATEAVPPALTSSAIGMVSGIGEIFGGGIAPVVAGFVAQRFGIEHIFWIPMVGLSIGIVVSLGLLETAPRFIAKKLMAS